MMEPGLVTRVESATGFVGSLSTSIRRPLLSDKRGFLRGRERSSVLENNAFLTASGQYLKLRKSGKGMEALATRIQDLPGFPKAWPTTKYNRSRSDQVGFNAS